MADLWEALKSKLDERLNWDTFKTEVGQGFDTMPEAGMVITPSNIAKFSRALGRNRNKLGSIGSYPTTDELVHFIATRYPKIFSKAKIASEYTDANIPGIGTRYDPSLDTVIIGRGRSSGESRIPAAIMESLRNSRLRASDVFDEVKVLKNKMQVESAPTIVGEAFAKYLNMKYGDKLGGKLGLEHIYQEFK